MLGQYHRHEPCFLFGGRSVHTWLGLLATAATEDFSRCFLQRVLDRIGTFLSSSVWVWLHTLFTAKKDLSLTSAQRTPCNHTKRQLYVKRFQIFGGRYLQPFMDYLVTHDICLCTPDFVSPVLPWRADSIETNIRGISRRVSRNWIVWLSYCTQIGLFPGPLQHSSSACPT